MIARRVLQIVLLLALAVAPAAGPGALAQIDDLPDRMEVPPQKPEQPAPDDSEGEPAVPEAAPLPEPRPERPEAAEEEDDAPMPAEEVSCRERLRAAGVAFSEHPPISEEEGCMAAHPLLVTGLPGGVELRPAAVLTCAMAEATAGFVRDHASPLVEETFGSPLSAIDQVSSYVCRARASGSKLSEHAFANALDWGSLELDDGTSIDVRSHRRAEPRRARLIARLRDAACGPFKTVLGPGSDADHADHFHFDMAERRGGGVWCE